MFSLNQKIAQRPGHIVSDMDGEKVMLHMERGKYYNLGTVGGAIWDLLEDQLTVQQIVERLLEQYEIERDACEQQVQFFLEELWHEGLVHAWDDDQAAG